MCDKTKKKGSQLIDSQNYRKNIPVYKLQWAQSKLCVSDLPTSQHF